MVYLLLVLFVPVNKIKFFKAESTGILIGASSERNNRGFPLQVHSSCDPAEPAKMKANRYLLTRA